MPNKRVPFFRRFKSLPPAALWLAEDGRHYSGGPLDQDGYRPDMERLREYFKPGRRLYVCAWGAWAHGRACTVAQNPIRVWTRHGLFHVDIMVRVDGDNVDLPCSFYHLTPFRRRTHGQLPV